jgi:hypothetical protein
MTPCTHLQFMGSTNWSYPNMPTLVFNILYLQLSYHTRGGHMSENTGAFLLAGPRLLGKKQVGPAHVTCLFWVDVSLILGPLQWGIQAIWELGQKWLVRFDSFRSPDASRSQGSGGLMREPGQRRWLGLSSRLWSFTLSPSNSQHCFGSLKGTSSIKCLGQLRVVSSFKVTKEGWPQDESSLPVLSPLNQLWVLVPGGSWVNLGPIRPCGLPLKVKLGPIPS